MVSSCLTTNQEKLEIIKLDSIYPLITIDLINTKKKLIKPHFYIGLGGNSIGYNGLIRTRHCLCSIAFPNGKLR